jgi:hypothetical protein
MNTFFIKDLKTIYCILPAVERWRRNAILLLAYKEKVLISRGTLHCNVKLRMPICNTNNGKIQRLRLKFISCWGN